MRDDSKRVQWREYSGAGNAKLSRLQAKRWEAEGLVVTRQKIGNVWRVEARRAAVREDV